MILKNFKVKRFIEILFIYTIMLLSILYYINLLAVITLGDLF